MHLRLCRFPLKSIRTRFSAARKTGGQEVAYMTCYISTARRKRLATASTHSTSGISSNSRRSCVTLSARLNPIAKSLDLDSQAATHAPGSAVECSSNPCALARFCGRREHLRGERDQSRKADQNVPGFRRLQRRQKRRAQHNKNDQHTQGWPHGDAPPPQTHRSPDRQR